MLKPLLPDKTLAYVQTVSESLKQKFTPDTDSWWAGYNVSQVCYIIAFSMILVQLIWSDSLNIFVPSLVALFGLIRELLKLFQLVWSFTLGKAIVLVLYATTANFALAFAAMQINTVTGVEPTPFVFTLGFTTIVLLPFWITVASMLFFSIGLIVANAWLLIRLPLHLIGMRLAIHWEDKKHPLVTMLFRIFLIPFVIATMLQVAAPYFSATLMDIPTGLQIKDGGIIKVTDIQEMMDEADNSSTDSESGLLEDTASEAPSDLPVETSVTTLADVKAVIEDELIQDGPVSENTKDTLTEAQAIVEKVDKFKTENEEKAKLIRRWIAFFLFHLEAYPNSKCVKRDEQRSIILDENLALMMTPNDTKDYGYGFEVVTCEPRLNTAQLEQN